MNRDEETLDFFFPMIDDGGGEDIGYYYYWLFVGEEDKIKIKVKEERERGDQAIISPEGIHFCRRRRKRCQFTGGKAASTMRMKKIALKNHEHMESQR